MTEVSFLLFADGRADPEEWRPNADESTSCSLRGLGLRVEGLGFRVEGLGFRVEGSGLRV